MSQSFDLSCKQCDIRFSAQSDAATIAHLSKLVTQWHETEHEAVNQPECTGLVARWCPIHGDCTCPDDVQQALDDPHCPLHAPDSEHS